MKIDRALINVLEKKEPMPNEKLQDTVLKVLRNRGKVVSSDIEKFYGVGYEPQQLIEIILVLSQKVISN